MEDHEGKNISQNTKPSNFNVYFNLHELALNLAMLSKVKNEKLTTTSSSKGTELTAASVNFHSVRTIKN